MSDENRNDFEEQSRQQTQGAPAGGRSPRGPMPNPAGETEPQGPVPPYEGRKERADTTDHPIPSQAGDENIGGAAGIRSARSEARPQPSSLDPGGGTSPGDFQPAAAYTGQREDDEGVPAPAATPGVARGERRAAGKTEEELEQERDEPGVNPVKPIDEDMPHMGPADQGS